MGFYYQWIEHELVDGRCTRCGEEIGGSGAICLRTNQRTGVVDLRYQGRLDWASPCERRTL